MHPGGPFWRNKDEGGWSIPKGEISPSEDREQAARREFAEELGPTASIGPLRALGEVRQRGGKRVIAFAGEAEFDAMKLSKQHLRDRVATEKRQNPNVPRSRSRRVARSFDRPNEDFVRPDQVA